jgi:type II secretory pathway pseudopilin PulG
MFIRKGFSLVELLIILLLLAIIGYVVSIVYITSGPRGEDVRTLKVAQTLAEEKLSEVLAQEFAEVLSKKETKFTGEHKKFSYEVVVEQVPGDEVEGGEVPQKNIKVIIRHPALTEFIQLEGTKSPE